MRKYYYCLLIPILLLFNLNIVWAENTDDYFNILIKKWIIKENDKRFSNQNISRVKFWRAGLILAWYDDKKKEKNPYKAPNIIQDQWYSKYANEVFRMWLVDKQDINPLSPIKKLEAIEFTFKLFWISTPYYSNVWTNFVDVKSDNPIVAKCITANLCELEKGKIFWAEKMLKTQKAYKLLIDSYNYKDVKNTVKVQINSSKSEDIGWIEILKQMISSLESEYYKPENLNIEKSLYWAMEWFANSLWDKYTVFMKPEESTNFNENIDGEFEWIWAYIEKDNLWIKIISAINWSPAQNAWLKTDDIILEASWAVLKDIPFQEGVLKIKWPKWSKVKLKIKRWNETFEVTVERKKIDVPSIEDKVESDIVIIKINQFNKNTDEQFKEIIKKYQKMSSLVIDLRWNPWWYLDTVENILSMFIEKWQAILQVKYSKENVIVNAKESDIKINNKKIAILTDSGSASASEILAWSLQDYWIAKIVWGKSYWKWTVQTIEEYYDWSQFKYTVAQWLTAKWNSIQDVWVKPDIEIRDDPAILWDDVVEKAKNIVR